MSGEMHSEGEFGFQIAPMLDVFFVLLLFFMVSSGAMKQEKGLAVALPGRDVGPIRTIPVVLEIAGDGQVTFNGVATDAPTDHQLPQTMARLRTVMADAPERPVILELAASTRHQRLIDVLDMCKAVRVKNVLFSANVE